MKWLERKMGVDGGENIQGVLKMGCINRGLISY